MGDRKKYECAGLCVREREGDGGGQCSVVDRDRRAAGQHWQVKPIFYSALSECVMAAQLHHLKISAQVHPLCSPPRVPPCILHPSAFQMHFCLSWGPSHISSTLLSQLVSPTSGSH